MSVLKWPRKGWGLPSWQIQEWLVGMRVPCLGYMDLSNLFGEYFPISAQGYGVHLSARVHLHSHALHSIHCRKHQLGVECYLAIRCTFC